MPDADGVLTLSERFNGIETALGRIETKLDHKVDQVVVDALGRRIEMLESGDTPLGKYMLKQFETNQQKLDDIVLHGSQHAQENEREMVGIRRAIEVLQSSDIAARTIADHSKDRNWRFFKWGGLVLGALSTSSVVISAVTLITTHH